MSAPTTVLPPADAVGRSSDSLGSPLGEAALTPVIKQALSAFDDAVLILHAEFLTLAWSSPAVHRLIPALADEGISAIVNRMEPALSEVVASARNNAEETKVVSAVLSAAHSSPKLDCAVCCVEQQWVAIRFSDTRDHFSQLQSYMEEREKLFTTSRTISVSEMATTLAHELNQPIGTVANILKGVQSRLAKKPENLDEIVTALDRAIDQSQFAARIISRIRDFTQSRQPSRVDCDIFDLLEQSVDLLDWVVDKADVKVSFTPPQDPIVVNGDPTMLQQVFTNLIRNAVDSMRESDAQQRKLALSVSMRDGDAQIEIADTGHGLSKTAENNLFVPFVTQKSQGMGVGLNICRSFVELHQGRLWLAQNQSGGCTSFVVLPVTRPSR